VNLCFQSMCFGEESFGRKLGFVSKVVLITLVK